MCELCARFRAGGELWRGKQGRLLRAERAPGLSACTSGATLKRVCEIHNRVSRAAVLSLNQLHGQWLSNVVKARVRTRTFRDYEALVRLNLRPVLDGRLIGTITQIDMQSLAGQRVRNCWMRYIRFSEARPSWNPASDP